MYTLILLAYIVVSLFITLSFARETVGWDGRIIKAPPMKEAVACGFSVIPIIAVFLGLIFICTKIFVWVLIHLFSGIEWIYFNLP
jgi:hypothetical protein